MRVSIQKLDIKLWHILQIKRMKKLNFMGLHCRLYSKTWESLLLGILNMLQQKKEREQLLLPDFLSLKILHSWLILQPDNLNSHREFVPVKFAKCLSRDSECIKVQDSDGREWPGMTMWCGGYCRIKGLAGLLREKNLDEGDICIFELIRVNELKVSVFYAST
ncbi:hypothetical protein ACOSQ2_005694 [Xanthoceras sorbifolium]